MMMLTVMYVRGTPENFIAESFQQGEMALTLTSPEGFLVSIPSVNIKAVRVGKADAQEEEDQTTEPADGEAVEWVDEGEDNSEQEETSPPEGEAQDYKWPY